MAKIKRTLGKRSRMPRNTSRAYGAVAGSSMGSAGRRKPKPKKKKT